jgi:citrate lyase beta subunit
MEKDLTEVLKAEKMPQAVMLPKVERPADIDMVKCSSAEDSKY